MDWPGGILNFLGREASSVKNQLLRSTAVDLSNWFLTDDASRPKKFKIPPGQSIPAGGYLVFDESQFNNGTGTGFAFSAKGDQAFLFSANGEGELTGYFQ